MELLLALSDLESSQVGEQTSLFQMRSVCAELQRAWRALEKSVREAQGEDAWNFARVGADETCGCGSSVSSSPILHRAPCASVSSRAPLRHGREVHP